MDKMQKVQIEGIATFSKGGFSFDSGLPSNEPVFETTRKMHGTLKISKNACAEFVDNGRVYLPPEVHPVAQGFNYNVKRTTRHYIISIKVPVVENRQQSEETVNRLLPKIMGDITIDRNEILDSVINA